MTLCFTELTVSDNQNGDFSYDGILSNTSLNLSTLFDESDSEKNDSDYEESLASNNPNSLCIQGIKNTQSRCFICQSVTNRKVTPWAAVQQAWFEKLCYIPKTNRTCQVHLTSSNKFNEEALQKIDDAKQNVFVNNDDLKKWLHKISDLPKSTPYNFDEGGIEPERYKMFLGISKDNFDDLVQYLHGIRLHFFLLFFSVHDLDIFL